MKTLLLKGLIVASLVLGFSSANAEIIYNGDGTYTTIMGNTAYHPDGSTTTRMGNIYYHSDGSSSTKTGDSYYHSNERNELKIDKLKIEPLRLN